MTSAGKCRTGQYVQHRFYVGKDRDTAMLRVERLERLWDALEAAWKEQRQSGVGSPLYLGDERPVWNPFTLAVAMAVARGDAEVEINPAADEDFAHALLSPMGLAEWFGRLSALVAGCGVRLVLTPEGQRVADEGRESIRQYAANRIERARKEIEQAKKEHDAVPRPVVSTPNGGETLHKALDAFADFLGTKYVTRDGITTPAGKRYQRQTKQIKEYAPDMPLSAFGLAGDRRPAGDVAAPPDLETQGNAPQRRDGAGCHQTHPAIPALAPPESVQLAVARRLRPGPHLDQVHGSRVVRTGAAARTPDVQGGRTLYVVGIRLAVGAPADYPCPELRFRWPPRSPRCNWTKSPSTARTGITPSTAVSSSVSGSRRGCTGEWMLWPETVRAIEWMKRRRGATQETALVLTKNGRPLNQQTAGGSRNMRIPNTWNTLLKRIRRKDFPTFRKLSFNKLRKTAASFVRRKYGGEVAGMFRGTAGW